MMANAMQPTDQPQQSADGDENVLLNNVDAGRDINVGNRVGRDQIRQININVQDPQQAAEFVRSLGRSWPTARNRTSNWTNPCLDPLGGGLHSNDKPELDPYASINSPEDLQIFKNNVKSLVTSILEGLQALENLATNDYDKGKQLLEIYKTSLNSSHLDLQPHFNTYKRLHAYVQTEVQLIYDSLVSVRLEMGPMLNDTIVNYSEDLKSCLRYIVNHEKAVGLRTHYVDIPLLADAISLLDYTSNNETTTGPPKYHLNRAAERLFLFISRYSNRLNQQLSESKDHLNLQELLTFFKRCCELFDQIENDNYEKELNTTSQKLREAIPATCKIKDCLDALIRIHNAFQDITGFFQLIEDNDIVPQGDILEGVALQTQVLSNNNQTLWCKEIQRLSHALPKTKYEFENEIKRLFKLIDNTILTLTEHFTEEVNVRLQSLVAHL
jgi:hypothetical protein